MSWIMSSLALLLHIVLSLTACSYVIIFKMYLEISVTGQCQTNIYLAWNFVWHSKKVIIISVVDTLLRIKVKLQLLSMSLCSIWYWRYLSMMKTSQSGPLSYASDTSSAMHIRWADTFTYRSVSITFATLTLSHHRKNLLWPVGFTRHCIRLTIYAT